jgi:hypothetical protein
MAEVTDPRILQRIQQQKRAQPGGIVIGQPDPTVQTKERRAESGDARDAARLTLAEQAEARARDAEARANAAEARARATSDARGGVETTEAERTAAFLATRLAKGMQQLRALDKDAPGFFEAASSGTMLGNYLTDENRQRVVAAQREILDSALTLGTGAAYTAEQIESYRKAYFPQPGDKPGTIADKMDRLQTALGAARIKAGAAASQIDLAINPPEIKASGSAQLDPNAPYSTDEDKSVARVIDAARRGGATFEELSNLHQKLGRGPLGDDVRKAMEQGRQDPFEPAKSGQPTVIQKALTGAAETPVGTGAASYLNAGGFGIPQLLTGDAPFEAMRDENFKSALAGDVLGGLTGTAFAANGLMKAGMSIPRAATAANVGYGAAFGANTNEDNRALGSGVGTVASLLGEGAGRYIAAPALTAAADTRVARALIDPVRNAVGMGRTPQTVTRAERSALTDIEPRIDDVAGRLDEAATLGVPYSIADADPSMRQTLGSATRLSPEARASVGSQLRDRSNGQADRIVQALSQQAPVVDMRATSNAIRTQARSAADPLYREAFAMPAPVNSAIDEMLSTPAGSRAARSAYDIALNEGRSPAELALALNPDGTVRIDASPTYETLDLIKRGFDQSLNEFRNPVTGRLDLEGNPMAQSIEGLRQRFVSELDAGNPIYSQAREAYASNIRPRAALQSGYDATGSGKTPNDIQTMIASLLSDPERDAFRSGYTTSLADQAGRLRDSGNPFEAIAGAPAQREKLGIVFPEGSRVASQLPYERDMAETSRAVLGGSPTQERALADQRFTGSNLAPDAMEIGASAITGVPPVNIITRALSAPARGIMGQRGQRAASEQANSIATLLSNSDPLEAAAALREMLDAVKRRQAYEQTVGSALGLTGGAAATGAAGGL